MLINEVESITGLTKKSIRYYEDNGLLSIERNNNKYRIYTKDDVDRLKTIKILRELGISIKEIKNIFSDTNSLNEILESRVISLELEEDNLKRIKTVCEEIIKSNADILDYFEDVNVLNKENISLKDIKVNNTKKIIGATLASLVFVLIFSFFIGLITYFEIIDPIPFVLYLFIILSLLLMIISIIYNLVIRIIEIKGGEEDESSKY